MPRNGSGSYSLYTPGNPVVTNTTISSSWANNTLSDIATALTNSLAKDGQTTPTANLPMGGFKLTGLGSGTAAGNSLRFEQLFSQGAPTDIASGATVDIGASTTNFLTVTGTTTITSFGTNYNGPKMLMFSGALTLTHNATTLVLPSGVNITTTAGDSCIVIPKSTVSGTADGWKVLAYQTASGASASGVSQSQLQNQTYTYFTTGGSSTAYTLTPTPAVAALAAGQKFSVNFHTAAGASPTLAISGLTAKNLKYYDSTGTKQTVTSAQITSSLISDVFYDGTDYIVLNVPYKGNQINSISASVASNALTISASSLALDFRSTTLGSGTVTTVSGTPSNLVISSGSTLGTTNAVQSDIVVLAINNAGTIELAAVNISGGVDLSETGLISTTAEGGGGAADSATTIYSTTARSNVAYRVLGIIRSTQATAGTWVTAPSLIQGAGGQAFTSMQSLGYGQTWQNVTGSRTTATTYYNTTGKPIIVTITAANYGFNCIVNGVTIQIVSGFGGAGGMNYSGDFVVQPGQSYSVTNNTGSPTYASWFELR